MLFVLIVGFSVVLAHPLALDEILSTNVEGTLYGSTLFAFLAIFVFTLASSLSGRVLAWLGLWIADLRGRDNIYNRFNQFLPAPVRAELDSLISEGVWTSCTTHSPEKRLFLILHDRLAALDFNLYSEARRDYVAPTSLLRNVAAAVIVAGVPLVGAWCLDAVRCGSGLLALGRILLGMTIVLLIAESLVRLYFRSLEKEMSRFLRFYLVLKERS